MHCRRRRPIEGTNVDADATIQFDAVKVSEAGEGGDMTYLDTRMLCSHPETCRIQRGTVVGPTGRSRGLKMRRGTVQLFYQAIRGSNQQTGQIRRTDIRTTFNYVNVNCSRRGCLQIVINLIFKKMQAHLHRGIGTEVSRTGNTKSSTKKNRGFHWNAYWKMQLIRQKLIS